MKLLPWLIAAALLTSVAFNLMSYASMALNVIQGREIRTLQLVALERLYQIYELKDANDGLLRVLNDREAMESFMLQQTEAYHAVLDTFYKVRPPMPLGNVPKDPELRRRALEYYRTHGEPWSGDPDELLTDETEAAAGTGSIPDAAVP